jgi:ABC-type branched-subunit amino acid transport system substrate-binding protein
MSVRRGRSRQLVFRVVAVGASACLLASLLSVGASAAPQPKGKPIKVMLIHEKTAGLATPGVEKGAIAAVKAINKAGGVKGRPLKFIECDTQNDPNVAAACGRKAVSEGVVALVGSVGVQDASYLPIMEANKIPSVGHIPGGSTVDFTSPAVFPVVGGAPVAISLLTGALADQGAKKIAVVRPDIAAGAAVKAFADQGLKRFGQTIASDVAVPTGAPDMSSYVASALANGTDGVLIGLAGQDAVNFAIAARQANPKVKLALISTDTAAVAKALGKAANGILRFSYLYPPDVKNKATAQFAKDMKAIGVKDVTSLNVEDTYVAVKVLAAVAKTLPEVTAPALFAALPKVDGLAIGLGPKVQFVKGGVAGIPRLFTPCALVSVLKNGKDRALTGKIVDAYTGQECPV